MARGKRNDRLAIPAVIRIKQDNGKTRVFRRKELIALLAIPNNPREIHRQFQMMPSIMGFWNYYAEVYRSRYERLLAQHDKWEAAFKFKIERHIRQSDTLGDEYATTENVNRAYYQDERVDARREKLRKARHKYNVLCVVADVLKEKNWNMRTLLQRRMEH